MIVRTYIDLFPIENEFLFLSTVHNFILSSEFFIFILNERNYYILIVNYTANICLFKVNNRNTRKRFEICLKLSMITPERRHWRHSGVFIVNFDHISHLFSGVSIIDFEQVNGSRVSNAFENEIIWSSYISPIFC